MPHDALLLNRRRRRPRCAANRECTQLVTPTSPKCLSTTASTSAIGATTDWTTLQNTMWVQCALMPVRVVQRQNRNSIAGRRLTPEQLHEHVAQQSRRFGRQLGLNQEDLCSEAMLKLVERGEWITHANPEAYCTSVLRTTAIDLCRRRQRESEVLERYAEELAEGSSFPEEEERGTESGSVNQSFEGHPGDDFDTGQSSVDQSPMESDDQDEPVPEVESDDPGTAHPHDTGTESFQNPMADVVDKLSQVDWGDSSLAAYCMLDGRILMAKKLQKVKDDEFRHVGDSVNDHLTRVQMFEKLFPWDGQTSTMEIGDPAVSIQIAWDALGDLVIQSAIYAQATRREREHLTNAKLSAALIVGAFESAGVEMKPNTWTTNCVRAWRVVKAQFPEIAADLKPHSRGQNNA